MPKRDDAHMKARRAQIMEAAARCLVQKGLRATSIADIRQDSGLSTGAIYVHFQNKAQIIAAFVEQRRDALTADLGIASPEEVAAWLPKRLAELLSPQKQTHFGIDLEALAQPDQSEGVADLVRGTMKVEQEALIRALDEDNTGKTDALMLHSFLIGAALLTKAGVAEPQDLTEALSRLIAALGLGNEAAR